MLITTRFYSSWSLADIFDDGQWCPIDQGHNFEYTEGDTVRCAECGAKFYLRMPGGDDGVVIDCFANPRGIYAPLEVFPGPYHICYFWQVLKPCNAGLADRVHWNTNSMRYSAGSYTIDSPLLFAKVYSFNKHRVTQYLVQEQLDSDKKYRQLQAKYDEAQAAGRDTQKLWGEMYSLKDAKEKRLLLGADRQLAFEEGLYFEDQCERIFHDDGMLMHGCLPKQGERPGASHPFYVDRAERRQGMSLRELQRMAEQAADGVGDNWYDAEMYGDPQIPYNIAVNCFTDALADLAAELGMPVIKDCDWLPESREDEEEAEDEEETEDED